MRDLHARLKEKGFDWPFVRSFVLPDWWEDELADVESNRALAEAFIAKQLGFNAVDLRDRDRPLRFPPLALMRFKRYKNQIDDGVRAAALVGQRAAEAVVRAVDDRLPAGSLRWQAGQVRDSILRESPVVALGSLLRFCWGCGIPVIQLEKIPAPGKRFDGMATFVENRPVIVLASGRDGAPWLAFYVAHELGHILLGHVRPGREALVDTKLDTEVGTSSHEREADRFACEVLTGFASPRIPNLGVTAPRLAVTAARHGPEQGMDPGVYVLIYAKSNNRWPVAQNALKLLGLDSGGRAQVSSLLDEHLQDVDLSEMDERFLNVLKAA